MPYPYGRRDWQTKIDRAVGRTSRGAQQGRFPGARPVSGPSSFVPTGGRPNIGLFGELHYIEGWDVEDDTDSTFRTTYEPLSGSWNLTLNGLELDEDEFSIDGKIVTIADPVATFLGADTQDSPWRMRIQYDYLSTPSPVAPPIAHTRKNTDSNAAPSVTFTTFTASADSLLLLAIATANGDTPATPTGYALVDTVASSGTRLTVFSKTAVGSETSVSTTTSGSTDWVAVVLNYASGTVVDSVTDSQPAASVFLDTGVVGGALAVAFLSGLTSGSKSGSMMLNDTDLTDQDSGFTGYLGLQAGDAAPASFRQGWGIDGLDQVTGSIQSIVVGLEA